MVLFRAVDIGAELYAMAATCVRAQAFARQGRPEALEVADVFCRGARSRIAALFADLFGKNDIAVYKLASDVLKGRHAWLEEGIIDPVAAAAALRGAGSAPTPPAPQREPAATR
jgi:hypothetical protein